ncbi:MAG: endonuclease MutS2 [Victivallales bacterium]|nr:endonuclease MutS2 [Victivallales bacterium]
MNQHSLQLLDFPKLLEMLGGYCQSDLGRNLLLSLRPDNDVQVFQRRRNLYADILHLQEMTCTLPGLFLEDLTEILLRVSPSGAVLSGEDLLRCRSLLAVTAEVTEFLAEKEVVTLPTLCRLASRLDPCADLRQKLDRSLDADGTVLDSASEKLRAIRRDIAYTDRQIQRSLDDILKSYAETDILQDNFVTVRNGRFVIPVKREARSQMPGFVHDLSNSGQTLFLEPSATLEMGNNLASLRLEERDEVRRILASLSSGVRAQVDALRQNQQILAELDAANGVGHWAVDYHCLLPAFGGRLRLEQARHPLLQAHFRQEGQGRKVVPLDFDLPKGVSCLAITGSNTGGKTVALKTIGLLALCAQSGLPVPVGENSVFTIFDNVLADIGDEQSLQTNLSTFSGHLHNIADILDEAPEGNCLVLLDELGSGTDPLEGGALACGILDALAAMNTLTIATTHLGMVKNYVHSRKDMLNAAVRFNIDSLQPEYILDIGRPGASHALHIARKLGLPSSVLSTAEGMLSGEHLRLEDMLSRMENEQHRLDSSAEAAAAARQEAEQLRTALEQEKKEFRKQRRERLNAAFTEAKDIVLETRREMENLLRSLKEASAQPQELDAKTKAVREQMALRLAMLEKQEKRTTERPAAPLSPQDLRLGLKVWVPRLESHGRITGLDTDGKQATVLVNGIAFTLKTKELEKTREPDTADKKPQVIARQPRFTGNTSHELVLVGMRVEDAIARLDAYLNDCLLARLQEVRIVHGFGTGRLRQGIHDWLRQQQHIKSFRLGKDYSDPGGAGCTIVTLF